MTLLSAGFPPYGETKFFQSHWQLTQRCNFHCPYCVNEHLRSEGIYMSADLMLHALKLVSDLDRSHFHFCLSGGEVTLYPHLTEMLEHISRLFPEGSTVTMMSNGSATASRMRDLLFSNPRVVSRFVITVHLGQTDVDKLANKLLQFSEKERKNHFNIKVVMAPGDGRGIQAAEKFVNVGINNFEYMPVLDFKLGAIVDGYTAEEMKLFCPTEGRRPWFHFRHVYENSISDVTFLEGIEKHMFHYKGMFCSAGPQSIFLDEHGNVSRGQFCGRMPYSILEKNPFDDPAFAKPAKCHEEHCTCIPFTALPKWSNADYAPISCRD